LKFAFADGSFFERSMSEQLIAITADTSRIAQNHSNKEQFEEIAKKMKDCAHIIKSMGVGPHNREIFFRQALKGCIWTIKR